MRRRTVLAGLAALAAATGGAAVWTLKPFRKQYPHTPYDDVLARLGDRDWAARFGATALTALPAFTPAAGAARLRRLLGKGSLKTAALRDAESGRLVDAGGWLVPESVALMAALARSAG